MKSASCFAMALFAIGFLVATSPCFADVIQLENGDTLRGKIVSLDDKEVQLQSDVLGKLSIPRSKVTAIVFSDLKPSEAKPMGEGEAAEAKGDEKQETPAEIIKRLAPKDFGPKQLADLEPAGSVPKTEDEVIDQLRREGVDQRLMDELHLRLPGFGAPQVQGYFNDKVNGLISGSITIQDIRKDAIGARDQLLELKEDLGPDAAALDGYLGILENFINKTAPPGGDVKDDASLPMIGDIGSPKRPRTLPPMATPKNQTAPPMATPKAKPAESSPSPSMP